MKYEYQLNDRLKISGDVNKLQHIVRLMSFLEALPERCPSCGASVRFFFRDPQNYEYYGLKCTGAPSHETNFGQKKHTGEFFYKGQWAVEYQGDNQQQSQGTSQPPQQGSPQAQQPPPENDVDDLPF